MLRLRSPAKFIKNVIQARSTSYYVTTPIFYVNSSPHIGHVYTLFLADALNIHNRLKLNSQDTLLSTGTDEHGLKIQLAAEKYSTSPKNFCDLNANKFKSLFDKYETTVGDFIRTTEDRHKESVISFWKELDSRGFIYKSSYSGWYCSSDETFVPESQVTKKETENQSEPIYVDNNDNQVVWSSEENYMFKLTNIIDEVTKWLTDKKPIVPEKFNTEAICMIKDQSRLGDISISRPVSRLVWGIQVPRDSTQTIYVWLDALLSYLTVVGYPEKKGNELTRWPIDCQVIGKDILKFHAIYWPAFLLASSLEPPKRLICHSHWLMDSMKMSKSKGNVIDPNEENQLLTEEGLRYFLLRNGTPHSDTNYSRPMAVRRINNELADTYGNLVNRCCGSKINPNSRIPTKLIEKPVGLSSELRQRLEGLYDDVNLHYNNGDFYKGLEEIMKTLRLNNLLYEELKPWKLIKLVETDEKSFNVYSDLQAMTFENIRICSILLQPIVPKIAKSVLDRISAEKRSYSDSRFSIEIGGDPRDNYRSIYTTTTSTQVAFRKIKLQEEED